MNHEKEFDFAQGTEFEKSVMNWMWGKKQDNGEDPKDLCKPDIYDVKKNIMYECKMTRPYYDIPREHPDAKDIGTGLPKKQFDRYVYMRKHGVTVVFIHKMSEGKYKDKIFISELTDELINKVKYTPAKNCVIWLYEDLTLINDLVI
jgi:hypothetical protein